MTRILSLDPGEKRIGLAISDELGWTAQGLPTLESRGMTNDLIHLAGVVNEYQVNEIVVGIPYREDGTLGDGGTRAMGLVATLTERFQLPVTPWDERLTTRQAERLLIEGGVSRAKRKKHRDQMAAVLILQNYLDSRRPA